MPWTHAIYTDTAREKIAEHGIIEDEVEQVLEDPAERTTSRSSGLPIVQGWTKGGRWIVVVFRELDPVTVEIITAYEPE